MIDKIIKSDHVLQAEQWQEPTSVARSSYYIDTLTPHPVNLQEESKGDLWRPIEWIKSWFTAPAQIDVTSFTPEKMLDGVEQMIGKMQDLLHFTNTSFADPKVESVELPPALLQKEVSREDYRELLHFYHDNCELLDHVTADSEAFLLHLMKVLAKSKEKSFDFLREQILQVQRDRKVDDRVRIEASERLIAKIQSNPWYDWFFEASSHTTLAFAGLALGASTGEWGWSIPLLTFAGIGAIETVNGDSLKSSLSSITAQTTSLLFGGEYDKVKQRHKERWQAAHNLAMKAMALIVATYTWTDGTAAVKATMSLSSITRNLGSYRKAQIQYKKGVEEGEIAYRADRIRANGKRVEEQVKELAAAYSNYTNLFAEQHRKAKRANEAIKSLFRR